MLAACTDGDVVPTAVVLSPREVLVGVLQLQLPPTPGPEPLTDGTTVYVTPTEIAVTHADRTLVRHIEPRPLRGHEVVLDPLYDAVVSELPAPITTLTAMPSEPRVVAPLDLVVDARVTMPTLMAVLSTLSRAGAPEFRLVGGTAAQPGGVTIELAPACATPAPAPTVVTAIRTDLALRWDADGARAWALPRPADRGPFDIGSYPNPFDDTPGPGFPDEVPLRLTTEGDPPLDLEALGRLVTAVCTFNHGAFGIELSLPETMTQMTQTTQTTQTTQMTQRELLAVLVAADPGPECRGPRVLAGSGTTARTGPAVTLDALEAHVLALANAPTHSPTPP